MTLGLSEYIISAIIQGITEFLPISSSGHIIILSKFLGYKTPDLSYQIYLHAGSLMAVIFVLKNDLLDLFKSSRQALLLILIGSVPVLTAGLLLKNGMGSFFGNARLVGFLLLANGIWLLIGHFSSLSTSRATGLNPLRAFFIGIAQAVALFPGISRSGATISCGLFLGMDRTSAYRFSFLLFIPAIISALMYDLGGLNNALTDNGIFPIIIGVSVSFVVSIAALKVLFSALNKSKMYLFSIYCFIVGLLTIIMP